MGFHKFYTPTLKRLNFRELLDTTWREVCYGSTSNPETGQKLAALLADSSCEAPRICCEAPPALHLQHLLWTMQSRCWSWRLSHPCRLPSSPTTHLLYISVARDPSRRDVSRPPGERISDSTFGETGRRGVSSSVVRVFDLRWYRTSTSYMYHRTSYCMSWLMRKILHLHVAVFTSLLTYMH